ncbi:MAG: flagellar basal body rod protein FlgB [Bacillota bacterium]|nr:flagellar basal body rod protein FlgB [Bacillota bacterium]
MGIRAQGAIDALDRALGRASLRGELLANNLANVNTPGYKRLDLAFEDVLASASTSGTAGGAASLSSNSLNPAVTNAAHIAGRQAASADPEVIRAAGTSLRSDGNNVDIESEMALLAENSLYYQALVREMNNRLSALRLAITEGRR